MKKCIRWQDFEETPCTCGHPAHEHCFVGTERGCNLCQCRKFHPQPGLRVVKKDEKRKDKS